MQLSPWITLPVLALCAGVALPLLLVEEPEVASEAEASDDRMPEEVDARAFQRELVPAVPFEPSALDPLWVDPATLPIADVELSELRGDPGPWLGRRVRFHLQYVGARPTWEAFLTRFGPADFVAFEAWADREYPWEPSVYANPTGTLFARRGSVVEATLALARKHQRFEAVGVVRDAFLDEPWIELQTLRRRPEHIPEGTILHVQQASEFEALEQWELALDQLHRARSAPLPLHAADALEARIERIEEERELVERLRRRRR